MEHDLEQLDDMRRTIRFAAILTLVICVAGVAGLWMVSKLELWRRSMFFEHFAVNEPSGIAIIAAMAIVVFVLAGRPPLSDNEALPRWLEDSWKSRALIAVAALIVVRVGAALAFQDYALVDDEYSGLFQARIFAHGDQAATVGAPWCEWVKPLTPTSIAATDCVWRLSYFPVNALLHAGFLALHLDSWAHPVMVALSVLLVMDLCRRAWPGDPERPVLAGLFLATSTQFLLMAMSAFSMPAHLLASAAWLWLFVNPRRWALIALPIVGVIALGVHSPFPHILFAAPLVLRFLYQRRFGAFVYIAAVYAAGLLAWVGWRNQVLSAVTAEPVTNASAIAAPVASVQAITTTTRVILTRGMGDPITASLSTVILGTWNVPIALLCVLLAVLLWRRLDPLTRWMVGGLAFTLFARAIFFGTYGAGWGNRYAHAVLPEFAIAATAGLSFLAQSLGRRRAYQLAGAAFATAILLQLPLRGVQAARIIRPYAAATRYLDSLPADVVVLNFQSLQWGRQLLRNDPFLRNRPKLMDWADLPSNARESLERQFPGRVRYVRPEEITALGVKAATRIGRFEIR